MQPAWLPAVPAALLRQGIPGGQHDLDGVPQLPPGLESDGLRRLHRFRRAG